MNQWGRWGKAIVLLKWLVKFNIMAYCQRNHLAIRQTNGRKGRVDLFYSLFLKFQIVISNRSRGSRSKLEIRLKSNWMGFDHQADLVSSKSWKKWHTYCTRRFAGLAIRKTGVEWAMSMALCFESRINFRVHCICGWGYAVNWQWTRLSLCNIITLSQW